MANSPNIPPPDPFLSHEKRQELGGRILAQRGAILKQLQEAHIENAEGELDFFLERFAAALKVTSMLSSAHLENVLAEATKNSRYEIEYNRDRLKPDAIYASDPEGMLKALDETAKTQLDTLDAINKIVHTRITQIVRHERPSELRTPFGAILNYVRATQEAVKIMSDKHEIGNLDAVVASYISFVRNAMLEDPALPIERVVADVAHHYINENARMYKDDILKQRTNEFLAKTLMEAVTIVADAEKHNDQEAIEILARGDIKALGAHMRQNAEHYQTREEARKTFYGQRPDRGI